MTESLSSATTDATAATAAPAMSDTVTENAVTAPLSPAIVSRAQALAADAIGARGAYAVLDQYGVIDALGADALDFLHNQLTNDVAHLTLSAAAVGGLCSPKGRLIASFLYWRQMAAAPAVSQDNAATSAAPGAPGAPVADGVRLLISADIREAIQKRLSMFVLRAKVKLSDATPSVGLIGLSVREDQQQALLATLSALAPSATASDSASDARADAGFDALPDTLRGRVDSPAGTLIRLSEAAGFCRYLLVVPRDTLENMTATLDASLGHMASSVWDWLDVRSAEPRITAATQEAFVPQMINFEAIGGVSFRKGCYPGQEVVARSQYRGTVKRRATLARFDGTGAQAGQVEAIKAGVEIFEHSVEHSDPQQPCGHVVNVAPAPDGGVDCLVELKLALGADALLHVGSIDGPRLTVEGLPYALPDLTA